MSELTDKEAKDTVIDLAWENVLSKKETEPELKRERERQEKAIERVEEILYEQA